MNWMQQFKQRIRQKRESEPTPQPDPTPAPKASSTDRGEVSERKRKALPSPLRMQSAYRWLCSFDMADRIRGRCKPETKCRFLVDWLSDDLRQEYKERGDLRWRDWDFACSRIEKYGELLALLDELLGEWWREASDEEWLQVADDHYRCWQEDQDKGARIIGSVRCLVHRGSSVRARSAAAQRPNLNSYLYTTSGFRRSYHSH